MSEASAAGTYDNQDYELALEIANQILGNNTTYEGEAIRDTNTNVSVNSTLASDVTPTCFQPTTAMGTKENC